MKRILTLSAWAVLAVLLANTVVWAQGTAQISGTVRDQSGAVLPGVEIIASLDGFAEKSAASLATRSRSGSPSAWSASRIVTISASSASTALRALLACWTSRCSTSQT